MLYSKSIFEIIKERTSWRTYLNKPLDNDIRKNLRDILKLNETRSPFKNQVGESRFQLISIPEYDPQENIKIGTYGMIKGAQEFIAGATERSNYDLENFGYLFETIILKATDLNLGTCWLGGTFSRSEFSKLINLKTNEKIPAVTPVGYPAERRIKEKIIRSAVNAKVRKPWEEIFFHDNFLIPLKQEETEVYRNVLEMVRIGPSAGNRQPWRILKEKNKNIFHFFVKYSEDKKASAYNKFVRLDIGIAICHFDLSARELGLSGQWELFKQDIEIPKNLKYEITWNGN